jgi:hypothetical protein
MRWSSNAAQNMCGSAARLRVRVTRRMGGENGRPPTLLLCFPPYPGTPIGHGPNGNSHPSWPFLDMHINNPRPACDWRRSQLRVQPTPTPPPSLSPAPPHLPFSFTCSKPGHLRWGAHSDYRPSLCVLSGSFSYFPTLAPACRFRLAAVSHLNPPLGHCSTKPYGILATRALIAPQILPCHCCQLSHFGPLCRLRSSHFS